MEVAKAINHLIAGNNLSGEDAYRVFENILRNRTGSMSQGGFLAAMTAKGATAEEIAAIYRVIYDQDTEKVTIKTDRPIVENSGTGMDRVKTFNISTGAAIVAASCGAAMARHGSRGITSQCGTVDVCEKLGIDVEAEVSVIGKSIETCGLGLFNGMSPKVHPQGLARILGELNFGTVLNIAASLANPAAPKIGIRGVYDPGMIDSTAEIMRCMGYEKILVFHGMIGEDDPGMDEISLCGKTLYTHVDEQGRIERDAFYPEDFGLKTCAPELLLSSGDAETEARRLITILSSKGSKAERDIVIFNAAAILWLAGLASDLQAGIKQAEASLDSGKAYGQLEKWVMAQSDISTDEASEKLRRLYQKGGTI